MMKLLTSLLLFLLFLLLSINMTFANESSLSHLMKVSVGDWSCDSHCGEEVFYFKTNLTANEIRQLHFECEEPEEANGEDVSESDLEDVCFFESKVDFALSYMLIAKSQNPEFHFELIQTSDSLSIGGYGLFSF